MAGVQISVWCDVIFISHFNRCVCCGCWVFKKNHPTTHNKQIKLKWEVKEIFDFCHHVAFFHDVLSMVENIFGLFSNRVFFQWKRNKNKHFLQPQFFRKVFQFSRKILESFSPYKIPHFECLYLCQIFMDFQDLYSFGKLTHFSTKWNWCEVGKLRFYFWRKMGRKVKTWTFQMVISRSFLNRFEREWVFWKADAISYPLQTWNINKLRLILIWKILIWEFMLMVIVFYLIRDLNWNKNK